MAKRFHKSRLQSELPDVVKDLIKRIRQLRASFEPLSPEMAHLPPIRVPGQSPNPRPGRTPPAEKKPTPTRVHTQSQPTSKRDDVYADFQPKSFLLPMTGPFLCR